MAYKIIMWLINKIKNIFYDTNTSIWQNNNYPSSILFSNPHYISLDDQNVLEIQWRFKDEDNKLTRIVYFYQTLKNDSEPPFIFINDFFEDRSCTTMIEDVECIDYLRTLIPIESIH